MPAQRMVAKIPRTSYPEEEACEAGVGQVDLRRLDDAFPMVGVMRGEEENQTARLQYREPALDRRM